MTTIPQIMKECRTGMEKAVEAVKHQFNSIRSGKASASMLDSVKVEMYGAEMALNQVATVGAPEARLLVVTPFDKTQAKAIEKAIRDSNLGLDPAHQGGVIRVPLPSMNEERRKELAKVLHKYAEDGHIASATAARTGATCSRSGTASTAPACIQQSKNPTPSPPHRVPPSPFSRGARTARCKHRG